MLLMILMTIISLAASVFIVAGVVIYAHDSLEMLEHPAS